MVDYIILSLIVVIAMLSAGYRMDEQFVLPISVNKHHEVNLTKKQKKIFFLKNKTGRRCFLTAAIIQQIIAFIIFIMNVIVVIFLGSKGDYLLAKHINLYLTAIDLLGVVIIGMFYKLKVKFEKRMK